MGTSSASPVRVETPQAGLIERTACPVCEGSDTRELCRLPYTRGPVFDFLKRKYPHAVGDFSVLADADYALAECRACEAIFQRGVPNEELLRTVYEQWAEDPVDGFAVSRRNRGVAFFRKHADQIIDILAFIGRNPYDVRVFDFAFGWGHWCRLVQGFGCTVYGTELSEKRRECAAAVGINVVPMEDIPNHRFDWMNANQVFEHLSEPLETLRLLKSGLAAGGILTMAVPGGHRIKKKISKGEWSTVFEPLMPLEHLNYFPRGCLEGMAKRAGLVPAAVPERFVWRHGPSAWRQNVKAVLNRVGVPVSNHVFLCFQREK